MTLTPEQFNQLVTKTEFNELKQEVSEIKGYIGKIMISLDNISKTLSDNKTEQAANIGAHDRFQAKINNHETRITTLEAAKKIA